MGKQPNNKKTRFFNKKKSNSNGGGKKSSSNNSSKTSSKTRKTLQDYVYCVGSPTSASDYVTVTNYLINTIKQKYTRPTDIATALENLVEWDEKRNRPTLQVSQDKDDETRERENRQFEKNYEIEYSEHLKRKTQYDENKVAAEALIWGQCDTRMRSQIQSRSNYDSDIKGNPIALLKAIKEHAMNYQSTQYEMKTIHEAIKSLFNLKQKDDESVVDYYKRFKVQRDVFLSHMGPGFSIPATYSGSTEHAQAVEEAKKKTKPAEYDAVMAKAVKIEQEGLDKLFAYVFLANSDSTRFGSLLRGLHTQYSLNQKQYPTKLLDAQQVLQDHRWDEAYYEKQRKNKSNKNDNEKGKNKNKDRSNEAPSLTLAQVKSKCYCCGGNHKLPDCSKKDSTPKDQWVINKTKEVSLYQSMVANINTDMASTNSSSQGSTATNNQAKESNSQGSTTSGDVTMGSWQFFHMAQLPRDDLKQMLVMDSGSSENVFCNRQFLHSIKAAEKPVDLTTSNGQFTAKEKGELQGYKEPIYLYEDGVANVLSLALTANHYHITYDNRKDDAFYVHTDNKVVRFARNANNLYVHAPTQVPETSKCLLTTVEENIKIHTPREVERAKKARELISILGSPTIRDVKTAIAMNAIANLPVRSKDLDLAERIFGKDLGILKGKTVRTKPLPMVSDQVAIPKELYEHRDQVELCIDIMFVNNMPYFTSISRDIYYRTANRMPSRTADSLYQAVDEVFRVYNSNKFTVSTVYSDNEWKPIFDEVKDNLGVTMIYSSAQAHVPEAERNNRTIKERIRATFHRLPYKALPHVIMQYLVSESARKLNYFPNKHGISKYFSPRLIVTREPLDYKRHCQFPLGAYVQAHDEPQPSNTQAPRTLDAVYLRPTDTGHDVYDIGTRRVINRRTLTQLPITPAIINAVNEAAKADGQTGLRITTRDNKVLYDSSWTAGVDYEEDSESDSDSEYETESEDDDSEYNMKDYEAEEQEEEETDDETSPQERNEVIYEDQVRDPHYRSEQVPDQEDSDEDESSAQSQSANDEAEQQSLPEPRRSGRVTKPPTLLEPSMKGRSHGDVQYQHLIVEDSEATEYEPEIAQYAANLMTVLRHKVQRRQVARKGNCFLVNYSLKKGIEKFGDKGYESAKSEMQQLHDRECWTPIHISTMSPTEKRKALESLIFLVEKKSGKIKARHCANGSKQRQWMDAEETSSPTVMTESVLLTATIDAHEKRDVATFDIPNAFIQTNVEERDAEGDRIVMKIRGAMVDMLVQIDPDLYAPFVTMERGQKVMYVHILKAIYGMLMSGLLFYKKFRKSIEEIGYEVNPYDPCVANKIIDGKQHTLCWHVDDVKASHVDSKVNDRFQEWLTKEYGQERAVTGTRGKKHVYLGMLLDYGKEGEVKVDMREYIQDMVDEFPAVLKGKAATPANESLFKVGVSKKLDPMRAEVFHTFTAKALFLTKRARPDILPTTAFLCTRVQQPTALDWAKLTRLMDFLKRTKEDCLSLSADNLNIIKWGIDASFAVHPDMKSHTGLTMTLGKGSVQSVSRKQRLNTRSSTEAELVGVDDGITSVIWTKNFMEAQGYEIKKNIILQDNQSAIKLENNGPKSAGQRSRHINIRYFFVTDQIAKGNIEIVYCPTDDLDADYMSKPLQGTKFNKFRKSIMNLRD